MSTKKEAGDQQPTEENLDNQPDNQDSSEGNNQEGKKESTSDFEAKFAELENKFNKALNGVVAKLEKKQKTSDEATPPKKEDSKKTDDVDSGELTIAALKKMYDAQVKELKEQIDSVTQQRESDKKEAFKARLESKVLKEFNNLGFDDPSDASQVFALQYPADKFISGKDGVILFETAEDEYTTLEELAKDWKNSKIGKRFLKVTIPNGANLGKSDKAGKTDKTRKLPTLKQIDDALASGEIKINTNYK